MTLESSVLGVASASAGFIIAVLFFTRRRHVQHLTEASRSVQSDLEQVRHLTSRIVQLEDAINKLKVECAAANIKLVSLTTLIEDGSRPQKEALPTQEDSWTRSEN